MVAAVQLMPAAAQARMEQRIYEFLMGLPVDLSSREKERIARAIFGYLPLPSEGDEEVWNSSEGEWDSSGGTPEEPDYDYILEVRVSTPPPGLTELAIRRRIAKAALASIPRPSPNMPLEQAAEYLKEILGQPS